MCVSKQVCASLHACGNEPPPCRTHHGSSEVGQGQQCCRGELCQMVSWLEDFGGLCAPGCCGSASTHIAQCLAVVGWQGAGVHHRAPAAVHLLPNCWPRVRQRMPKVVTFCSVSRCPGLFIGAAGGAASCCAYVLFRTFCSARWWLDGPAPMLTPCCHSACRCTACVVPHACTACLLCTARRVSVYRVPSTMPSSPLPRRTRMLPLCRPPARRWHRKPASQPPAWRLLQTLRVGAGYDACVCCLVFLFPFFS